MAVLSFGLNTGAGINPARDMGPRLLSLAISSYGSLLLAVFSFGLNTGAGINPARDMGPRLLSALAGWPGTFSVSI